MILQLQRQLLGMLLVWRPFAVSRRPREFDVVLHQHTVMKNRHARGMRDFSVGAKRG